MTNIPLISLTSTHTTLPASPISYSQSPQRRVKGVLVGKKTRDYIATHRFYTLPHTDIHFYTLPEKTSVIAFGSSCLCLTACFPSLVYIPFLPFSSELSRNIHFGRQGHFKDGELENLGHICFPAFTEKALQEN